MAGGGLPAPPVGTASSGLSPGTHMEQGHPEPLRLVWRSLGVNCDFQGGKVVIASKGFPTSLGKTKGAQWLCICGRRGELFTNCSLDFGVN